MARTRSEARSDDGVVLLMVLAFVTAIAVVSTALLAQTEANLRYTVFERQNKRQIYAASAAVDYGIQQLRTSATACPSGTPSADASLPYTVDGRTPTWSCVQTPNTSSGGAVGSDWGLFLTGNNLGGNNAAVTILGKTMHVINGPVYNGHADATGNINQAWNISPNAGLTIANGFVTQFWSSCPLPGTINNLFVSSAPTCVPTQVPTPLSREALAASAPAGTASPNPTTVDANCVAFNPGHYTTKPNLTGGGKVNFFRGGVYYFDNIGSWNFNGDLLLGGTPQLGEASQTGLTCSDPTQGGVMFVFGGNSSITVTGTSKVELFPGNAAGGPGVSFYQVVTTAGGWTASTVTSTALIQSDETGASMTVLHGQLWAPNGSFKLTQGSGGGGKLRLEAGVVVSDISNVNNPGGSTNFYASGARTVTLVGKGPVAGSETGSTVVARAVVVVYDDPLIAPKIASWRLS